MVSFEAEKYQALGKVQWKLLQRGPWVRDQMRPHSSHHSAALQLQSIPLHGLRAPSSASSQRLLKQQGNTGLSTMPALAWTACLYITALPRRLPGFFAFYHSVNYGVCVCGADAEIIRAIIHQAD